MNSHQLQGETPATGAMPDAEAAKPCASNEPNPHEGIASPAVGEGAQQPDQVHLAVGGSDVPSAYENQTFRWKGRRVMTCIVLVKNPNGGVLAIGDDGEIAQWSGPAEAEDATKDQPLVKAWGGFVVDLDALEVREV